MKKILITLLVVMFIVQVSSIRCNFTYKASDVVSSETLGEMSDNIQVLHSLKPFKCDDSEDDDEWHYGQNRFKRSAHSALTDTESEYYETAPLCESNRMTIMPKALNNVYNQHKNVPQYTQTFSIEICKEKNMFCNYSKLPAGKVTKCRQKYMKFTLKAINNNDHSIKDEDFYFPSHCLCSVVTPRKH